MLSVVCTACGADAGRVERVGRRDTCTTCGADLHSCRQCRFHDPRAYNECTEPQAERVVDKTRANFCDYFRAADPAARRPPSVVGTRVQPPTAVARDAPAATSRARDELERLFKRR